jgi:hypothetical protein
MSTQGARSKSSTMATITLTLTIELWMIWDYSKLNAISLMEDNSESAKIKPGLKFSLNRALPSAFLANLTFTMTRYQKHTHTHNKSIILFFFKFIFILGK